MPNPLVLRFADPATKTQILAAFRGHQFGRLEQFLPAAVAVTHAFLFHIT